MDNIINKEEKKLVGEIINELENNPNEDGSISPNIMHWIEKKQSQLRRKYLSILTSQDE